MPGIFSFLKKGSVRRGVTRWAKESRYVRTIRLLQPEFRLWFRDKGKLPDFLIIGAQRSGSTFLHDYLSFNTSAVSSSLQKELHFFDNKYYKGIEWYARFFESAESRGDAVKSFESSPYYLYHPAVPRRIKEHLPDIKVVAVLRNPVQRTLSQYRWMRQVELETRSAVEAFQADARRADLETDPEYLKRFDDPLYFDFEHIHYGYIRRSLYHHQLKRWLRHFDASKIRLVSSGDLFSKTEDVMREVASFLEVDHHGFHNRKKMNQNTSKKKAHISKEAVEVAERALREVPKETEEVVNNGMVIGDRLSLT